MSDMFVLPLKHLRMVKYNDSTDRDRCFRFYKESPDGWQFQLRAPIGIGFMGLKDGKDFIIAMAACSIGDLIAIRDAIDAEIKGAGRE